MKAFFQIIPQKLIDKVGKKIYSDYCKNPKTFDYKIKRHKDLKKQLTETWRSYQRKKGKLSDKELLKTYQNLIKVSREWWYYGVIGEDKGEIINQEIVPKFAKKHNLYLKKAREIITILSHPKKQSVFNVERKDFLNICLYVLNSRRLDKYLKENSFSAFLKDKKLNQKVKEYIKRNFWFKTDFCKTIKITPESLLKEIFSEVDGNKKTLILKELKDIDRNFKKISNQKSKLLATLKLNKEDRKDIYFAQSITYWFDQRKLGTMVQFHYIFSFLEDIAKRYNLKYHDLATYTVDEVEDLLIKKKRVSRKDIVNRNEGVFFVYENSKKAKMFYGKKGKKMFKTAIYIKKQKEIKGQIACTGGVKEIKGKVRIVYNPAKDKFNKGKILVSSMTRIEFLPYMREAKAIITNEGGIACHAAIVSRELNIPCIIGTKVATKVLENGNRVRMDMVKGEIEII